MQVGSWRPEPGIRHYHVSLNENEKLRWVGDFAEIIKCHNPGATGPHETEPLPRLKVTTFLVRTHVHTLLALLETTWYRTIFCVFVILKATGNSSQMSISSNFLSYWIVEMSVFHYIDLTSRKLTEVKPRKNGTTTVDQKKLNWDWEGNFLKEVRQVLVETDCPLKEPTTSGEGPMKCATEHSGKLYMKESTHSNTRL